MQSFFLLAVLPARSPTDFSSACREALVQHCSPGSSSFDPMSRSWSNSCLGDAILGNSEISHITAGACKDKFLSMLCSSDHFLNMKPLGASRWEVIVTFPKSARAVMDDASGWAASVQLGLNALSTCCADAVEDEESGLLDQAKLLGVATTPELLQRVRHSCCNQVHQVPSTRAGLQKVDFVNKICTCPCHRQWWPT